MQNSGGAGDDEGEEADLALMAVLRKNRTVDGGFQDGGSSLFFLSIFLCFLLLLIFVLLLLCFFFDL